MWNQENFQWLLIPLVSLVTDLKALFPCTAVGVVKGQEVINIQQLIQGCHGNTDNSQPADDPQVTYLLQLKVINK